MYQEEVFEELKEDPYFQEYTMEQCQQDLAMLTEWKNLNTIQDTRKVSSIEEFKHKKYRYQMSEYSVEIERQKSYHNVLRSGDGYVGVKRRWAVMSSLWEQCKATMKQKHMRPSPKITKYS